MPYHVRLMCKEDISQVTSIDREVFPTLWPPASYQHELHNRLAHYIVAYDESKTVAEQAKDNPKGSRGIASLVRRLFSRPSTDTLPPSDNKYIVGFVGLWIMADEAHITNVAVREALQRQGIGELLLLSTFDLAKGLGAQIVTLEVRVSNTAAQALYHKCGFKRAGLRRGYYTDNREDAIIMSTENINITSFQAHIQQLKQAHTARWGTNCVDITANPSPV